MVHFLQLPGQQGALAPGLFCNTTVLPGGVAIGSVCWLPSSKTLITDKKKRGVIIDKVNKSRIQPLIFDTANI